MVSSVPPNICSVHSSMTNLTGPCQNCDACSITSSNLAAMRLLRPLSFASLTAATAASYDACLRLRVFWHWIKRYLRNSAPPAAGTSVLILMSSSWMVGEIWSIIFRHRRAYVFKDVASSVALSNTIRMTWTSVRLSVWASALFAHAMMSSEIESKFSVEKVLRSAVISRSTSAGE
jgi:hypothetical protein